MRAHTVAFSPLFPSSPWGAPPPFTVNTAQPYWQNTRKWPHERGLWQEAELTSCLTGNMAVSKQRKRHGMWSREPSGHRKNRLPETKRVYVWQQAIIPDVWCHTTVIKRKQSSRCRVTAETELHDWIRHDSAGGCSVAVWAAWVQENVFWM